MTPFSTQAFSDAFPGFSDHAESVAAHIEQDERVDEVFAHVDECVFTYGLGWSGVEVHWPSHEDGTPDRSGAALVTYINAGDLYSVTLMHDHSAGAYLIGTLGDWREKHDGPRAVSVEG